VTSTTQTALSGCAAFVTWPAATSLAAFYGGPVWQAHRDAANATMIDSDNVLLLRPAWPGAGIDTGERPRASAASSPPGLIDATVFHLHEPATQPLLNFCRDVMSPALRRGSALALGWYVSEATPNNFPRLPVREGECVLVGVAIFVDAAGHEAFVRSGAWARKVEPALAAWLSRPAERLRLAPTSRSAIHA
jgi:hypothetical protein